MQLPAPPFWETHLIDHPGPLMAGLAILAVILFLLAHRVHSWRLLVAAITVLALIGAVFITGQVVVTPRQQLIERTTEWVSYTAPMDVDKVCRFFYGPTATVVGSNGEYWFNVKGLANKLVDLERSQLVQNQKVAEVQAVDYPAQDQGPERGHETGQSLLYLQTQIVPDPGFSTWVNSTWLIKWWRLSDGQWYAAEVRCLEINGQPAATVPGAGMYDIH
jgi:hypothetical protein